MKSFGSEQDTVQAPLLRYAEEVGWTYVPTSEALSLRKGEGGLLFRRVLEEKLIKLNPGLMQVQQAGGQTCRCFPWGGISRVAREADCLLFDT